MKPAKRPLRADLERIAREAHEGQPGYTHDIGLQMIRAAINAARKLP